MAADIPTIETVIHEKRGNLTRCSAVLGISRAALYKRIKASKRLQVAVEEARNTLIDLVEDGVIERALAGELTAQLAILNNHPVSRERGWGRNVTEVTGAEGGPIQAEITIRQIPAREDD